MPDKKSKENGKQVSHTPESAGLWNKLGGGERAGVIAVCLVLAAGLLAGTGIGTPIAGLFSSGSNADGKRTEPGLLSGLNPFAAPVPTPTPLSLSKEYIYAGSRLLAVEDAGAVASPPADLARISHEGGTDTWKMMKLHGQWLTAANQSVPKRFLGEYGFGFLSKTPQP